MSSIIPPYIGSDCSGVNLLVVVYTLWFYQLIHYLYPSLDPCTHPLSSSIYPTQGWDPAAEFMKTGGCSLSARPWHTFTLVIYFYSQPTRSSLDVELLSLNSLSVFSLFLLPEGFVKLTTDLFFICFFFIWNENTIVEMTLQTSV